MSSGTVATGTSRLHYIERGSGSAVLVLHGFTGSAAAMAGLVDLLARRHRVVALDLIGHGGSSAPASSAECSMEAVVGDVARFAADLGLAPMHVVGYSMGGRVALSLAVSRPDLVASLVAIGASAGIADAGERRSRALADAELAEAIERNGIEWFVDYWGALPLLQPVSPAGRAAADSMRRVRLGNDPTALARVLRGLGAGSMPPLHSRLTVLEVPALLIAGALDRKYRAVGEELSSAMPRARAFVIEGAGHAAHLDDPDAVAGAILPFLASSEQEGAE